MTEQEILEIYQRAGAVWFFDYKGDPKAPHAELTSGLCSDGYVNSAPVLSDPVTVQTLGFWMTKRLGERNITEVDWVIGSAYAAITFSYEVARQLGARHGFVEKDPTNPKKMVWNRLAIPGHAEVLQCEELITTLGTTMEVRRAVDEGNPEPVRWLPTVATAVYRPTDLWMDHDDIGIVYLVGRQVQSWKPEECPLCVNGSPRLRPKQHWTELTCKAA